MRIITPPNQHRGRCGGVWGGRLLARKAPRLRRKTRATPPTPAERYSPSEGSGSGASRAGRMAGFVLRLIPQNYATPCFRVYGFAGCRLRLCPLGGLSLSRLGRTKQQTNSLRFFF